MPKKDGVSKTYSFDKKTIAQLEYLREYYNLRGTSLLEFMINKEYKEIKGNRSDCK